MIKLFRNIRKNLLKEGKTTNYLKYAIGEIILVVIGILIALGINNWNNERQLKQSNKVFLSKMLKDLDANEKRLSTIVYDSLNDGTYPSLEEAVKACDSILKLTYLGLKESHFNYLMTAPFNSGSSLLNLNDNTYSELSNTGKLYSLGSETLVEAITTYYKRGERESDYNVTNSKDINYGFIKFDDGFGKLMMDYHIDSLNFNLNNYPFYTDKNSKEYKDYQIGMDLIGEGQNQNMIKMKELIIETIKLKDLIKNELQHD
ncbi:DUF6090 family protein [Aequorivita antarctica]|uniref:Uncharacterized protein n=1 Tax=Aequorivita antarctica TaxID=153266 RepID=A0A5C6YYJ2_9FLAO|nr:DUF6090 family protein [Aequorivita antarctica]TXD72331.1 hypothetical protein ESU54_12985 [Aequorivita antarctica]SRX74470.1 hypothetical protein AEQU3_01449 [Aequorivita antarctica]